MRLTLSQRLARKLQREFKRLGYGSQARFVEFSRRPGGTCVTPQNLSYFLRQRRPHTITVDDLVDLAAYFRVSITELLDDDQQQ